MSLDEYYMLRQAVYPSLFRLMMNDANFYVCLVKADPSDVYYKAYLEHPPKDVNVHGIIRIFMRKEDADAYANLVAMSEGIDLDLVKRWETPFTEVLGYVRNLEGKHKSLNIQGIRAVTSMVANDDLVDIDIFWTGEKEIVL